MKKELTTQAEIKLIGLTARTNNKNEMNPEMAKIGELMGQYHQQKIAEQIPNRTNAGVTLCVYTDYASDEHGDYTYFIGEQVDSFDNMPTSLSKLVIPAGRYQKFTTATGKMVPVVIDAWQQIWKMTANDFGGKRAYQADYEVYDQRAMDPNNASVDILIGIE